MPSNKKKSKAKGKEEEAGAGAGADEAPPQAPPAPQQAAVSVTDDANVAALTRQLELQGLKAKPGQAPDPHAFWDTQPVPKLNEEISEEEIGPVEETDENGDSTKVVPEEPTKLLELFEWSDVDMCNPEQASELYELLNANYVEDDDNMFRFDYSIPFLKWALQPPGFQPKWHVGVRVKANGKLVAFISGIPAELQAHEKSMKLTEINFLCIHKKLRSKRLAPVLIKEVTRRVNQTKVWQAVYTAGITLPRPMASCRYWHRSLDPKKLIEVGFSRLGQRMTMARTIKLYQLPDEPQVPGLRKMTLADVPQVTKLLAAYLKRTTSVYPIMSEADVAHWICPKPEAESKDVVYGYVACLDDDDRGAITDFISFYSLPSTVIGHDKHNTLRAAYSYYNVATKVDYDVLWNDALILAKQNDFDVFNALDVMENSSCLEKLKFGAGDGNLKYYLYNWKCPMVTPQKIGLVLL